jgi:hypothetical protein
MTRIVDPTINILKKRAIRSSANMFEKRVPVMPVISNQARQPRVATSPTMLR